MSGIKNMANQNDGWAWLKYIPSKVSLLAWRIVQNKGQFN
jgi:hypothetical protein